MNGTAHGATTAAIIAGLAAVACLYARGAYRLRAAAGPRGLTGWHVLAFGGGCLMLATAALPAVEHLAETSFAAHMAQHQILMLLSAPLLVLGRPLVVLSALPRRWRGRVHRFVGMRGVRGTRRLVTMPILVWGIAGTLLWLWHWPTMFHAALEREYVHALQHASFLGGALASWWVVLHGRHGRARYGVGVLWLFVSAVHTGLLGALLTMSPTPWYPLQNSGSSALADQQLAGLIMWVPSGLVHTSAGLILFAAWLRPRAAPHRIAVLHRSRRVAAGPGGAQRA